MDKNSLGKKGLAVAVILLFIGVSFAPSINANVSKQDDLVEFDVEFCGLGKRHTVQLTHQEADEVELLFDDIDQRLSDVETREEAENIFKEAIVDLDKYGLLGWLNVRQAQRLVLRNYYLNNIKPINNYFKQKTSVSGNINLLCLIVVFTDVSIDFNIWYMMYYYIMGSGPARPPLLRLMGELFGVYGQIKPFHMINIISMKSLSYFTIGFLGIKKGTEMRGRIDGFTGLKIVKSWNSENELITDDCFYMGFAMRIVEE